MTPLTIRLSEHFTLDEFTKSATAKRLDIDNTPTPDILINLQKMAGMMEQVRQLLDDVPVLISSSYRCPELNRVVGGVAASHHLTGLACDFTAPQFGTPWDIARRIAHSTLPFDQLILEHSKTATWVHLGIASRGTLPRRQILTIDRHGTRTALWR